MPDKSEISQQVAHESERRLKIGVPAVAGGVLYLISGIIISSTLGGAPSVGVLQGLAPALRGEANPTESPRAAEIKFQSHHAFGLIAGSVLAALAIAALVLVLVFLIDAARFRRPETNKVARWMLIGGGVAVAILGIVNTVSLAVKAHAFATGHDFSNHAAVAHSTASGVLVVVGPLTAILLVAGIVITMLSAVRVGLLPRWIAWIGGLSAVLLLLPAPSLDVVPAFWMVSMGILLMGKLPKGDPPAWAAGEARPWPTRLELRAQAEAEGGATGKGGSVAALPSAGAVPAPEPLAGSSGSSRRRRKRR